MNARKTKIIASREYFAAVRSKSFIISLVLLPIYERWRDRPKSGRKSATPRPTNRRDGLLARGLHFTARSRTRCGHNEHEIFDGSGRQTGGRFVLESLRP